MTEISQEVQEEINRIIQEREDAENKPVSILKKRSRKKTQRNVVKEEQQETSPDTPQAPRDKE